MKIQTLSDTHGFLPEIPECDLFLLAGDVMPYESHDLALQKAFLDGPFRDWLREIPAREIVWTAGNHDFLLETKEGQKLAHSLPAHFLLDQGCRVLGLEIWGTPWIPTFADWAFELPEEKLEKKFAPIPACDIILSHTPPHGIADRVRDMHVGSKSLLQKLKTTRLLVCGHIHEGRGGYPAKEKDSCDVINASYIDARYRVIGLPPLIDFNL